MPISRLGLILLFGLVVIPSNLLLSASATGLHHNLKRNSGHGGGQNPGRKLQELVVKMKSKHHEPGGAQSKLAKQFLIAHNTIRAFLSLQPLKWNRTLARYARHWANERIDDCHLQHSVDGPYGENMFWSLKPNWTPFDVVRSWGLENKLFNPTTNECIGNSICGHYTQIIWKNTTQLGCGRAKCEAGKGFVYVCSYDPPGNFYFEGPLGGKFAKSIVNPPPPGAP